MPGSEKVFDDVSRTHQYFVIDTFVKMRDARARGDIAAFFSFFEFAASVLTPHMSEQTQKAFNEDWLAFRDMLVHIAQTETNPTSATKKIDLLRLSFADAHLVYLTSAFGKAGITKLEEEGLIDFQAHDIKAIQSVLSNLGGLASSIKRVEERKQ